MESPLKYKMWCVDLLKLSFLLEFNLCIEQYELFQKTCASRGATKRKYVNVTEKGWLKVEISTTDRFLWVCLEHQGTVLKRFL